MPNPFRPVQAVKALKKAEKAIKAGPIKISHPMNPEEVYTFPAEVGEERAKEIVRKMLLLKARQGMQKIELPSELPDERVKALEKADLDLQKARRTIADMETRENLKKMSPGIYQDEATGYYYRVTPEGLIESIAIAGE